MTVIRVVAAVILDTRGRILLSRRAASAHQGGLWEFPGGKVEQGECHRDALARELREELGIEVRAAEAFLQLSHDYGDRHVHLDVWRVDGFEGEPLGLEGQPLVWVAPEELERYEFPAANEPIVAALRR